MPYYPANKIQTNLFSNGELIRLSDLTTYIGPYYKLSNGQAFAGKDPQAFRYPQELIIPEPIALPLNPLAPQEVFTEIRTSFNTTALASTYKFNLKEIPTTRKIPIPFYPEPNDQDYQVGYFTRYFAKQVNDYKFIEINQKTFESLSSHNGEYLWQLYNVTSLPWQISGNKEKVAITNQNIIKLEEQNNFKGLSQFLKKDYLKYYQFTNASNLYTAGGEYKTADGKNYIGYYHIHDKTGPMVGATHIKEPHGLLFPINENISTKHNQSAQMRTQTTSSYTPPSNNYSPPSIGRRGGGGGGY